MRLFLGVVGLVILASCGLVVFGVLRSDLPVPAKVLAAVVPASALLVVGLTGIWMKLPSDSSARFFQLALSTRPSDPPEVRRWRVARALLAVWLVGGLSLLGFLLLARSGHA